MRTFRYLALLSVLLLLVACQPIVRPAEGAGTAMQQVANTPSGQDEAALHEENKAVMRRFLETTWNERSTAAIDELLTPDAAIIGSDMSVGNPASVKLFAAAFLAGFSDFHMEIQEQIAEGDVVVTRWLVTGTHDGEFIGILPTGNQIELAGMTWTHHVDGKIDKAIDAYDMMVLMGQLGL